MGGKAWTGLPQCHSGTCCPWHPRGMLLSASTALQEPWHEVGTLFVLSPNFFLLFLLFQSLQTPRLSSGSTLLKSTPACPDWGGDVPGNHCCFQAIVEIKLPQHWEVLDLLLWWEMEISMCFLLKIMKYFLNSCFSLAGVYLLGVLNHPLTLLAVQSFHASWIFSPLHLSEL